LASARSKYPRPLRLGSIPEEDDFRPASLRGASGEGSSSVDRGRERLSLLKRGRAGRDAASKTMISRQNPRHAALGRRLPSSGFSTLARCTCRTCLAQESLPAFERRLRRAARPGPDLWFLDELGFYLYPAIRGSWLTCCTSIIRPPCTRGQRSTIISPTPFPSVFQAVGGCHVPRAAGPCVVGARRDVPSAS